MFIGNNLAISFFPRVCLIHSYVHMCNISKAAILQDVYIT